MTVDDRRPSSGPESEGFLGRWARRKTQARTTVATGTEETAVRQASPQGALRYETAIADEPTLSSTDMAIGEERLAEPGFDPASLPDIEKLGPGSDFSVFMQAGVPPALRVKALRKLWRVKAELANLDGLLDYGEDLTGSFKVVDQLQTAYQVGKGFLRDDHRQEDDEDRPPSDNMPSAAGDHEVAAGLPRAGVPRAGDIPDERPAAGEDDDEDQGDAEVLQPKGIIS